MFPKLALSSPVPWFTPSDQLDQSAKAPGQLVERLEFHDDKLSDVATPSHPTSSCRSCGAGSSSRTTILDRPPIWLSPARQRIRVSGVRRSNASSFRKVSQIALCMSVRPKCFRTGFTWPPNRAQISSRDAAPCCGRPCAPHFRMEETFGPVIPIVRAPDDDDALIALLNSTAFGLSSGECTNDYRRIRKYIAGLKVGTVNIWEVPGYRIEMRPVWRHQGFRIRLQGRCDPSHEELHERQNLLTSVVNVIGAALYRF